MSKSLGEKLFEANTTVLGSRFRWSDLPSSVQSDHERVGLAFCASLSHDETATATIEGLRSERESLLAALKAADEALCGYACRDVSAPFVACLRSEDECSRECGQPAFEALKLVRAALTTKDGT